MRFARGSSKPFLILAGLGLTLVMCGVHLRPPLFLEQLEHKYFDALAKSFHRMSPSGRVAIVDLDEASLRSFGQWPWPRYRIASLLKKIGELGAASVGLDIIFAEPDRSSLMVLQAELLRDLKTGIDPAGMPVEALDNDRTLAGELSKGPNVLAYQFRFGEAENPAGECRLHPISVAFLSRAGVDPKPEMPSASGVVCNIPVLTRAAPSSGFLNVAPDPDGTLRRVPLIYGYRGAFYPSLALAAVMQSLGTTQVIVDVSSGSPDSIRLGNRIIPVDPAGNMIVHYRGRRTTFEYFSAADVLNGRIPGSKLSGRIVFLGSTAAGLKETMVTPMDPMEPGVEIHATIADNLIVGDFLSRPRWAGLVELLCVLVLGIVSTGFIIRSRALLGLPFLALLVVGLTSGSIWLFSSRGIYASPLVPIFTMAGSYLVLTSLKYWESEREVKARTKKLLLTEDVIIHSLASLAEARDDDTGGHIQRTRHYVKALAEHLRDHPRFRHFLNDSNIDLLFRLAPLHDVGKVGVRDSILLKPEPLSDAEREEMKRHAILGSRVILQAEKTLGEDTFLHIANDIVITHHERWDGTGYPAGKKREEIPIAGRLMAVADVYDVLISKRRYKEPYPHEQAVAIMAEGRGTQFDPDVLDAFLQIHEQFRDIARRYEAG